MTNGLSVVIPVYNNWVITNECLLNLSRHARGIDEVVVVNDGSTDEHLHAGLDWWVRFGSLNVREERLGINSGFIKACNYGIKHARRQKILLLSNDVIFRSDVAALRILDALDAGKVLVGGIRYDHDTGWNNIGGRIYPYLEGWLLAFTRETWEELGGFDERYAPSDFEDVDLATTALSLGYRLFALNDRNIIHKGGQSYQYNQTRRERTERNQALFEAKWKHYNWNRN